MPIHFINVSKHTAPILDAAATVAGADVLVFERDILAHWAVRWESATPAERQTMIDTMRLTLGEQHGLDSR